MFQLVVLFLLLPTILWAESLPTESEILESPYTPLATLYGVPETVIFGVNVINGDYNYANIDFHLPGSDPLILQRSYCSSRYQCRGFWEGWTHNLTGQAISYRSECKKFFQVVTSGSLSGELPFKVEFRKYGGASDRYMGLNLSRDIFKKGVTNCGKREISGCTNIKNVQIIHSYEGIKVRLGDGTENTYRMRKSDHEQINTSNCLASTLKPNGLSLVYETRGYILHSVQSLTPSKQVTNKIHFEFRDNPREIKMNELPFSCEGISADGKKATYSFEFHKTHPKSPKKNVLLAKFESNCLPTENYSYTDPEDGPERLAKRWGERHATIIDYYKKDDWFNLYGLAPEQVSRSHLACHRVKQIKVAVNGPEDLQTTHQFAYYKNQETKDAYTDVYNSYNHLNRYHYSTKNYRLNTIERFKKDGSNYTLYRRERFKFGKKLTPLEGDLLFKTVENSNGRIHYGENFDYDNHGNVLKRKLHYHSFTNIHDHPIWIAENFWTGNQYLEGGEVKETSYTYNSLNLPTSEDDGRLRLELVYHRRNGKEVNLVHSKLFKHNGQIIKREFYEFDENAGCSLKVEDDGCGPWFDNQEGVKCQKIFQYKNREGAFAGLPEEIDQWGFDGKNSMRISRTVLKYDAHGYVEKEIHHDANNNYAYEIQKIRDIQGNITDETDAMGQITHRQFNSYGSLTHEQGPNLKYSKEYIYDWLQRPVQEIRHCCDEGNLITLREYDLEGHLTAIQDPYGFKTTFTYDEHGRLIEVTYPPIRTKSGEWIQPKEFKTYNFLGHLTSETNANGAVTLYTPNDAGLPLQITYPDGTSEKFSYSIYGELLEKKQRNGSKITYTYDVFSRPTGEKFYDRNGNLIKETFKKYSGLLLTSETDGEGLTTTYFYDYAGKISEVHQGRALTKFSYDPLGRIKEEQRYFGRGEKDYISTHFTYDLLNRVTLKMECDADGKEHSKIKTTYDEDGNITSTTTWGHSGEVTTFYKYDARGHLCSVIDPFGDETKYRQSYHTIFEEHIVLPCLKVTDSTGVKTVTFSDARGLTVCQKIYSPCQKLLSHEEMFYDLQGNLVRKENRLHKETIVTLREYDSSSRLIKITHAAGTDEQAITRFVYNSFGELSETHYPDGSSKHCTYDSLGRLYEEWSNDKSIHYRYTYNRQDLPTQIKNLNTKKSTIRTYNLEKDLKSEELENGLRITYLYDRLHRVTGCIYPDHSFVKKNYNPVSLEKVERFKNDELIYAATFSHFDLSGKPKQITFPKESGTLAILYDRLSRPKRLAYPHYIEKEITYDKRGLLASKIVNRELETFEHDYLCHLTLEKTSLYTHSYENDALHRQVSIDGVQQIHNALHQLTQGVEEQYLYDRKGRRKKDSTTTYRYDKFDRLITAKQGKLMWNYTYDAFNRKMSRTYAGETVLYLYQDNEEIGSFKDKRKNIDLKILSGGEGSLPIAIELGTQHYAPLLSSQGHIVGLVDIDSGEVADHSPLTLFGKDLSESPLSPWRFCRKRHEVAELGIIDFGYRHYHPRSAQWLTQDPLDECDGPNLYAYVKNSPACYIDRFGLFMDNWSFNDVWESVKEFFAWDAINEKADMGWENSFTRDRSAKNDFVCSPLEEEIRNFDIRPSWESSVSFGLDCMPIVGTAKATEEFLAGKDAITGQEVSKGEALLGIIPFAKVTAKLGKGVANLSKRVGRGISSVFRNSKLLPFTADNFRANLIRSTGISPGSHVHAHYIFPKEHALRFAKRGIDVHDPKHGLWWEATQHWEAHGKQQYNEVWERLLKQEPPLNKEELYDKAKEMMKQYGLKVHF